MRLMLKLAAVMIFSVFAHVMLEISDTVSGSFRSEQVTYFGAEQAAEVAEAEKELTGRSFITRWVVTQLLDVPVTASRRRSA